MLPKICEHCVYFEQQDENTGFCRRHAPTPSPTDDPDYWPLVLVNDWCGEYAPSTQTSIRPDAARCTPPPMYGTTEEGE